jgi:hypothetical protein
VPGAGGDQGGEVAHGVAGPLGGQIGRVGAAPAGWLAGVDLDQHASAEQLHQFPVGAGV